MKTEAICQRRPYFGGLSVGIVVNFVGCSYGGLGQALDDLHALRGLAVY